MNTFIRTACLAALITTLIGCATPHTQHPAAPATLGPKTKDYYYTSGEVQLTETLDSDDRVIKSVWYTPEGDELWITNWVSEDRDTHQGISLFLDDQGNIRAIMQGSDGMANGYTWRFDPPVSPSKITVYDNGNIVREHTIDD